jgi:hypothetical protein
METTVRPAPSALAWCGERLARARQSCAAPTGESGASRRTRSTVRTRKSRTTHTPIARTEPRARVRRHAHEGNRRRPHRTSNLSRTCHGSRETRARSSSNGRWGGSYGRLPHVSTKYCSRWDRFATNAHVAQVGISHAPTLTLIAVSKHFGTLDGVLRVAATRWRRTAPSSVTWRCESSP